MLSLLRSAEPLRLPSTTQSLDGVVGAHALDAVTGLLHCLLVPISMVLLNLALRVVLLVHVAGAERAVLALALEAAIVLLFLQAAAVVLLRPRSGRDDSSALRHHELLAGVSELHGALLVAYGKILVASRARSLLNFVP